MVQANSKLSQKPRDIDLSGVDFGWQYLRQAILDAHKPIQDMFFKGHGNYLQYIDSVMAEDIMLKFVKSEFVPVLPVHDSFIVHYGHGE